MDLFACPGTFIFTANYPWCRIARHGSAIILYCLAMIHWPGTMMGRAIDAATGTGMSTTTFTILFWNVFAFHYTITAGRVEMEWTTGIQRARGWLVRSSRRSHRMVLTLAMAVSSSGVLLTGALKTILDTRREDNAGYGQLIMVDLGLCLIFCLYVAIRLNTEPSGLVKSKQFSNRSMGQSFNGQMGQLSNGQNDSLEVDECAICLSRLANRQLDCNHLICCCCLRDMASQETNGRQIRCPFCRGQITGVRRLILVNTGQLVSIDQCCSVQTEEVFL